MASVDKAKAVDIAASVLNASVAAYGTPDDDLHPVSELDDAATAASKQVMATILDTPDHRHRSALLEERTFNASPAFVKGPIYSVSVDGRKGSLVKTSSAFQLLQTNRLAITAFQVANNPGYYFVEGRRVWFIGAAIKVETLKETISSAELEAPEEYLFAVVWGILATVFPKEGAFVSAANHFAQGWQLCLQLIREGRTDFAIPIALGV